MKCPLCDSDTLSKRELEPNLKVKKCSKCQGQWISSTNYLHYLEKSGNSTVKTDYPEIRTEYTDSSQAKICPDCGHILTRFKVGHGLIFYVDHCRTCNGLWLDKNEWEALCNHNLQDDLNKIFTTSWQNQIKTEELAEKHEQLISDKLGADYERVKDIKDWLSGHPQKSIILAYWKQN